MKTVKGAEPQKIQLDQKDIDELRKIKNEDTGMAGMVDEFVRSIATRKGEILREKSGWWDKIYIKYHLTPELDFIVDAKTGVIKQALEYRLRGFRVFQIPRWPACFFL